MKHTYSGKEVCSVVFPDQIHFSTLMRWCKKGILQPYHYETVTGNRYNKTLFTMADIVMVGTIYNILSCGITYDVLLESHLQILWDGHKGCQLQEIQWKSLGREVQEFIQVFEYRAILEWHTPNSDSIVFQLYSLSNDDRKKLSLDLIFGHNMACSGATTLINTASTYLQAMRTLGSKFGIDVFE